jgi:hypothetical protein
MRRAFVFDSCEESRTVDAADGPMSVASLDYGRSTTDTGPDRKRFRPLPSFDREGRRLKYRAT